MAKTTTKTTAGERTQKAETVDLHKPCPDCGSKFTEQTGPRGSCTTCGCKWLLSGEAEEPRDATTRTYIVKQIWSCHDGFACGVSIVKNGNVAGDDEAACAKAVTGWYRSASTLKDARVRLREKIEVAKRIAPGLRVVEEGSIAHLMIAHAITKTEAETMLRDRAESEGRDRRCV